MRTQTERQADGEGGLGDVHHNVRRDTMSKWSRRGSCSVQTPQTHIGMCILHIPVFPSISQPCHAAFEVPRVYDRTWQHFPLWKGSPPTHPLAPPSFPVQPGHGAQHDGSIYCMNRFGDNSPHEWGRSKQGEVPGTSAVSQSPA